MSIFCKKHEQEKLKYAYLLERIFEAIDVNVDVLESKASDSFKIATHGADILHAKYQEAFDIRDMVERIFKENGIDIYNFKY